MGITAYDRVLAASFLSGMFFQLPVKWEVQRFYMISSLQPTRLAAAKAGMPRLPEYARPIEPLPEPLGS